MDAEHHVENHAENRTDMAGSRIAAVIGEPTRARMLYCLLDGRARTSTELAVVGRVTPSTASAHLNRLKSARLVTMLVQGKHRYYSLEGPNVAAALEGLSVLAGGSPTNFVPNTPSRLRAARTCYDHMAGTVAVAFHDRIRQLDLLSAHSQEERPGYALTAAGLKVFGSLGVDLEATRLLRRRFACPCLDWSERRHHLGGALGAAFLAVALKRRWLTQDLDSRALALTAFGRNELLKRFDLRV